MVSTVASQQGSGSISGDLGLSVPVSVWLQSRLCSFLTQSKNVHVKRTGNSKLSLCVTASAIGWLSHVQGVTLRRQLG